MQLGLLRRKRKVEPAQPRLLHWTTLNFTGPPRVELLSRQQSTQELVNALPSWTIPSAAGVHKACTVHVLTPRACCSTSSFLSWHSAADLQAVEPLSLFNLIDCYSPGIYFNKSLLFLPNLIMHLKKWQIFCTCFWLCCYHVNFSSNKTYRTTVTSFSVYLLSLR